MNAITQAILNKSKLEIELIKITKATERWAIKAYRMHTN